MNNKLMISQAIFWAAAILVVAIVEDTENVVPILAVLATVALGSLNNAAKKLTYPVLLKASARVKALCIHPNFLRKTIFRRSLIWLETTPWA